MSTKCLVFENTCDAEVDYPQYTVLEIDHNLVASLITALDSLVQLKNTSDMSVKELVFNLSGSIYPFDIQDEGDEVLEELLNVKDGSVILLADTSLTNCKLSRTDVEDLHVLEHGIYFTTIGHYDDFRVGTALMTWEALAALDIVLKNFDDADSWILSDDVWTKQ